MNWSEWQLLAADEQYWQNREEPGLVAAKYLHDYTLRVQFADKRRPVTYELDFAPLLLDENPGGVFLELKDIRHFRTARADYALVWSIPTSGGGEDQVVDLAPECVRFFCEKYGRKASPTSLEKLAA